MEDNLRQAELLATRESVTQGVKDGRPIRIFMEGAFDLMHYGHMNAFRLGASLAPNVELVVGVNSSKSILECKGCSPCMSDEERLSAVRGCRFVSEVVPDVPYVMSEKYLNFIMEERQIDYVVHGDDPVIVNGKDVYAHVKEMGKYRSIPRTEGVSTTDIVGRMLLCGNEHHVATTLAKAKNFGDYLIVGVYSDEVANELRGKNYPIMNIKERVLSVLGCKYVDDVLIDAPLEVTAEMLQSLEISVVANGTFHDRNRLQEQDPAYDPYSLVKSKGMYRSIESTSTLSLKEIVRRINVNRLQYEERFEKKKRKEDKYYAKRFGKKEEECDDKVAKRRSTRRRKQ
eukprot:g3963.t1